MVPMDATLIEQTLINLMENAIYHSQSQAPIQVELSQVGKDAVFTVRDHGKGIPPERLSRLFEGGPAEGNGGRPAGLWGWGYPYAPASSRPMAGNFRRKPAGGVGHYSDLPCLCSEQAETFILFLVGNIVK